MVGTDPKKKQRVEELRADLHRQYKKLKNADSRTRYDEIADRIDEIAAELNRIFALDTDGGPK